MLAVLFPLLKSLHIIAVVSWFAGLLYLPRLFVYHAECTDQPGRQRFTIMQQRLYRRIMGPAMVASILFGFSIMPGFGGSWLWIKLGLVGLLVAFHISCGSYIKKLAAGNNHPSGKFFRFYNEIPTLILIAIVLLVVYKPSW